MNRFRKHLRPIGVGVSVAALAVGSTTLASASSSKAGAPQSITVTLYYTGLTNVDTDRNHKPSVGDIGVAPGFYVDSNGKRIGSAVSNCTQINAVGSLYTCRTASKFPSGEVFAEDRFDATKRTVGGRIL